MTRIAAVLIVFALTGGPIANAVCLSRCHAELMNENCDAAMTEPAVSSGNGPCPVLVADTPFVREEVRGTFDAVASLAAHPLAMPRPQARPCSIHIEDRAVDGARSQPVVLRV